jgi:DNA-binding LacI/PurR family transcriptional regulator
MRHKTGLIRLGRTFHLFSRGCNLAAVMALRSQLPPGKRATARDVAVRAGVSISAVSRAFTHGASVSPATRKKVMAAANALGYQPNVMARSLMTGRTALIGLAANNFANPAFMEVFDQFTRVLQDKGLRPLLVNLSDGGDPAKAIGMLQQYSVDAVIVASSSVSADFVSGCVAAGIPLVHAFGKAQRNAEVPVVAADNRGGGQLAADVLVRLGYHRIGFLGGPAEASSTADRLHGLRAGLRAHGLAPQIEVFAAGYSHGEGRALMADMLARQALDAVFCGDDILAMGARDACRAAGVSVPADMGLLGFNDIAMAAWAGYDLSTIRQPISAIISAAVELVVQQLAEPDARPKPILFPCEVILRGSLRRV